jgi:hypothetical protein
VPRRLDLRNSISDARRLLQEAVEASDPNPEGQGQVNQREVRELVSQVREINRVNQPEVRQLIAELEQVRVNRPELRELFAEVQGTVTMLRETTREHGRTCDRGLSVCVTAIIANAMLMTAILWENANRHPRPAP